MTEDTVRREIVLKGERERVWALVSDPAEATSWLADEAWLDGLTPGDEGLVRVGHELRRVVVDEAETGRRLALRWTPLPDGEERLVELTLDDVPGGGTRLVVVEVPWSTVRAVAPAAAISLPSSGPLMAV